MISEEKAMGANIPGPAGARGDNYGLCSKPLDCGKVASSCPSMKGEAITPGTHTQDHVFPHRI
jgi:hypothetical protein